MGNVQLHIHIIQTILSQVLLCVLVHYHADTWMFEPWVHMVLQNGSAVLSSDASIKQGRECYEAGQPSMIYPVLHSGQQQSGC